MQTSDFSRQNITGIGFFSSFTGTGKCASVFKNKTEINTDLMLSSPEYISDQQCYYCSQFDAGF